MEAEKEVSVASDSEEMDVMPSETTEKIVIKANLSESPVKDTTNVNRVETTDDIAMEIVVCKPSNKENVSPLGKQEKGSGLSRVKTPDHTKPQSMKRTSEEMSTVSKDLTEDLRPSKKLMLSISEVDVEPSKHIESTDSSDSISVSPKNESVDSLKTGEPKNEKFFLSSKRVIDSNEILTLSMKENLKVLISSERCFYSTRTLKLDSAYMTESKRFKEVRNPRSLYSNKYETNLGVKYFLFPLAHILVKDILDFVDFFNGSDACPMPEELHSSSLVLSPEEWTLQFVRPNFDIGIQKLEALMLNRLEIQFEKLVLEKLFGSQCEYKLDSTFFNASTEEIKSIKLEDTCQEELSKERTVENLKHQNSKTEHYFLFISHCLVALLGHIIISKNEVTEMNASKLTIDVLQMLRRLANLRKVTVRLLKMESTNILKVKYHTLNYFNTLLLTFLSIIKKFGLKY